MDFDTFRSEIRGELQQRHAESAAVQTQALDLIRSMSERLVIMERIVQQLGTEVSTMDRALNSTDTGTPGIALRLDRIERIFSVLRWMVGGGLVAVGGTVVLLYRIGSLLQAAG